jgi:hypothetical protein
MTQQYHINLEQFSLARFRQTLETGEVLPSRAILTEKIPERFAALESMGIDNLQALIDALSTGKKRERFAQESGLPLDYLVMLRRQARSYIPSSLYFKDIPGVDPDHVERLAAAGIKQTRQMFDRAKTKADRAALAEETGIPEDALLELVKMTDLARAGWIGPVFVRLIYETGTDTLEKLAAQSPEALFEQICAVNEAQQLTKAMPSVRDVAACIETTKELSRVIEY